MHEIEEIRDRVILVGIASDQNVEASVSLAELEELAKTAGAEVLTYMIQNRERPDPGTYLGKGKIEELKELTEMLDANGVICDDELSPAQLSNLQEMLQCKVMDRTLLILDIFAAHAHTSEGKIQVELAQLKYRASRLTGLGRSLSRLGGGIGTRGPGEKKLEQDRRLIRERIGMLKRELREVERHRDVVRDSRKKNARPTAAIVGYTNAGKSTLLNHLTDAGVLEEDALFATLDPTTRALKLPGGTEILLTDTVGFIRKLPHHLIESFKSTLEEAAIADYIIHVVDAADPQAVIKMQVVYDTLHDLKADEKPVITLFNKQDLLQMQIAEGTAEAPHLKDLRADYSIPVSAKTGAGLDRFTGALEELIQSRQILIERIYPYAEAGKLAMIRKHGQLLEEEYLDEGIRIKAFVPPAVYGKL
ncbi:MAG: GTPase HflX [Eubacterium sp.]|nr:GTPase HflX [Eubacterium sp.]